MFQCPTSGFSLFYDVIKNMHNYIFESFNALPRAFFFSTKGLEVVIHEGILFQCPTSGFLLFYETAKETEG